MHELSIAMSIVELAQEEIEHRGVHITAVHLKLGALSGVVERGPTLVLRNGLRGHPSGRLTPDLRRSSGHRFLSPLPGAADASVQCSGFAARNVGRPHRKSCRAKNSKWWHWRCRMNPEPRLVEVRKNVLKQNDVVARGLRGRFRAAGVFVVSLVSSPGSGKTAFLEKTLTLLRPNYRVAALVGDLATENDALRLARSQAPVKQITTGTLCHLEAAMVDKALEEWDLNQLDYLFIENVGNLVCPSSYDLGEDLRLVLISVTEGEDKPLKYPTIFHSADAVIVTKTDLAAAADFDWERAFGNIQAVRPGIPVLRVSAKTGEGMQEYLEWLGTYLTEVRSAAV